MKILIIDDNGVTEFIPSAPNQEDQTKTNSTLNLFKERLLEKTVIPSQPELRLYTMSRLLILFEATRPTIYSWIEKGLLKPIKLGGRVYFNQKDIETLLESNTEK